MNKRPDGREVVIKPTGEVIPTQRVWQSDGSRKFPNAKITTATRCPVDVMRRIQRDTLLNLWRTSSDSHE